MRKKILLFILFAISLSGCFVKSEGSYVLFFNPRIKCEYCTNQETILGSSEFLLKKVFGIKKIENYHIAAGQQGDSLILMYIRKESFDHIIPFQSDSVNKKMIDKIIQDKIDTNQMWHYFVFPDIEKYNSNNVVIAIKNYNTTPANGQITFRSDNVCKIIISKEKCRIIDWICW